MRKLVALIIAAVLTAGLAATVWAAPSHARIKDLAKVQGVRSNQLMGYGLVVGLAGTGDTDKSIYTLQSVASMLQSFGVNISAAQLKPKNVAAVMVTAQLPPFVKPGDTIDINISSLGDAKSLQGGVLLQTPLKAANGQVYAVGQGPLSVGGYLAGSGGSSQQKNFPTVGSIPGGAIVEREVQYKLAGNGTINLALNQPDFTTAYRISEMIDLRFGPISQAKDPGTVVINVPDVYSNNLVGFVAAIEELTVTPDNVAKVVINERTGTVVMGSNVSLSEVAVAQGGISIRITGNKEVSQPPPLSPGKTAVTENTKVEVKEQAANFIVLPATANVGDVVNALNAVGATPRDVIAILQAVKAAGALRADLQII